MSVYATFEFDVPTVWRRLWPCSTLAGCRVSMREAANGDLVELKVTREGEPVDTTDLAAELEAAREQYVYLPEARRLGQDAGIAAVRMMQEGDPAADDCLPRRPNLSGEFADDPTTQSLFEAVVGRPAEPDDDDLRAALCDEWEDGVAEVFEGKVESLR